MYTYRDGRDNWLRDTYEVSKGLNDSSVGKEVGKDNSVTYVNIMLI